MKRWVGLIVGVLCAVGVAAFGQAKPPEGKSEAAAPKAGGVIKIGAIFAVTGPASNLGAPEEKTARMLVEKINAAGGVSGQKIEEFI